MSEKLIITFEGNIKTVQPITVSLANKPGLPVNTMGFPMIPSSTLRGWLRHSVHNAISSIANSKGIKYSVPEHFFMGAGQDVHNKLGKQSSNERMKRSCKLRKENPFFSVYGRWLASGRLSVTNAVSMQKNCIIKIGPASRKNVLVKNVDVISSIDPETIDNLDKILLSNAISSKNETGKSQDALSEIKRRISELQNKLNDPGTEPSLIKLIQNQIKQQEKLLFTTSQRNVDSGNFSSSKKVDLFDAIDANHELRHSMQLSNPNKNDFMFFIWSLFVASKNPVGGKVSYGCGLIQAEYKIYSESLLDIKRKQIGVVGFNSDEGFYIKPEFDISLSTGVITKDCFDIDLITNMVFDQFQNFGKFS